MKTNYLTRYIKLVEKGQIRVSKRQKQYLEIVKKKFKDPNIFYVEFEVECAIQFIETYCKHYEGAYYGKKFELSLWQKAFIADVFGFYTKEEVLVIENDVITDKTETVYRRLAVEAFLMIASGNGKSTFCGAIINYIMFGTGEHAPKCFIASNAYDQSKITFDYAKNMILQSKQLKRNCEIIESRSRFYVQNRLGECRAMSSTKRNQEGINPSFIIVDEVHEMRDGSQVANLKKSLKRDDILTIEITTQGTVRGGYIDQRLEYLDRILIGEIDVYTTAIWIFEQDSKEELYEDILNAQKSNPQLGLTISLEKIKGKLKTATDDPTQSKAIFSKTFNIPQTETSIYFDEDECRVNKYDESILHGSVGVFGLDMSYRQDITVLSYRTRIENKIYLKQWFFIPRKGLAERCEADGVDYEEYAENGDVIILDGEYINQIDIYNYMFTVIEELNLSIIKAGVDPFRADQILNYLRQDYDEEFAKAVSNQYRKALTPTINRFKNDLKANRIYFNSYLTTIHLAGCVAHEDKDQNILLKKLNSVVRIDGAHSAIYAAKAEELSLIEANQ